MKPTCTRMIRCPECGIMRPIHNAHCECGSHNLPEYRGIPECNDGACGTDDEEDDEER